MKSIHASLITESNKLQSPNAWLTLIQAQTAPSTTVYLVGNPADVVLGGQTYTKFPVIVTDILSDTKGGLPESELQISNVTREMSAYVEQNELRGNRVRLLGVNTGQLDDPSKTVFDEEYEIQSYAVTQQFVAFRLGHQRLLDQRFPARRALRDNCQWLYKSAECAFVDNTHLGWGTVTSSGVTITGTDTKFTRLKSGDSITASGQTRVVDVVTDDDTMTVTVAPSPAWSGATFTITKPTCSQILGGNNGCRGHFGLTGPGSFGGFPGMPTVAGRLVG